MGNEKTKLTAAEVVKRWDGAITVGTLANWRCKEQGPAFQKFGRKVRYPVAELEKWEQANMRLVRDY